MKVLGINGSPRIGGNTDILLDKALEGAGERGADTHKIILNTLDFVPCHECAKVRDDGTCQVQDDMQTVYSKFDEADALILASPIFFGSISAQTKMMTDRFQCRWRAKYVLKKVLSECLKPGALICVQASTRQDFFDNAIAIVKNLFATMDVDYSDELLCPGVDEKGAVLEHPEFLEKAVDLGRRIVAE
jgi:multimeric flavodoxin WrbA